MACNILRYMPFYTIIQVMDLKEIRKRYNITQKEASLFLDIPMRTYARYENEKKYNNSLKYIKMCELLENKFRIDEDHGILTIDNIVNAVNEIFKNYNIEYAYLFGSYAKNKAKENSDVDIMINSDISGLKFYGLVEELRQQLKKKVDLIRLCDLNDLTIIDEILRDGVKIYG